MWMSGKFNITLSVTTGAIENTITTKDFHLG
jgi:hypothetical protein